MSINQLILRNLKKNVTNYYLYVFALIFSTALYFAFVTLQYDPSMDAVKGTIKGAAAMKAGSILLVAIVTIFLLYANSIFLKRRSKEFGLFQLIGMTKNRIFRILSTENFILYFGSLLVGILIGFSVSKLLIMILYKITTVNAIATLHFSAKALVQTLVVFGAIFVLILAVNYIFMKKQSILALFRVLSSTESKAKKISWLEIAIGIAGIVLIALGYYISSKLFAGDITTNSVLLGSMIFILASVIIGTYLFYKGSVQFLFFMIRKKKDGYLTIKEVLSLSSIMFRIKSNALLLTIITTVSALAIGLLSLSYIAYYSAEKTAEQEVPDHFSFMDTHDAAKFEQALKAKQIGYSEKIIDVVQAKANLQHIAVPSKLAQKALQNATTMAVISDKDVEGVDVRPGEALFTGLSNSQEKFMPLKSSGSMELSGKKERFPLSFAGQRKVYILSWYFTNGSFPAAIVDETTFDRLKKDKDPKLQRGSSLYIGININKDADVEKANAIFKKVKFNRDNVQDSQLALSTKQKKNIGLLMFIVGFLGLTFLVTSGCILYFKQMGEGEEEKPNYTILRKLGFTQGDLLRGIQAKQLFSFGIPLVVGLSHSYFAVQSGWFFFGAELWTPMIAVMIVYTALYSIFGLLSIRYYKKLIEEAL
ncbi:ABC transporter permease [Neobacillus sp. PS3-12]|uniref:ABC transporter permease n=1 Tax=Neobacillus sp. PS3-12 TaxID=3070677 RepID=UPI0027E15680|nr:ABC transporter permease [Neobacillus sp. PS3-12]WML55055.1 ABC transporter permease [Neobacillus sp. PS3-12]